MSVRLADRSFQYPIGIAENMLVEVGKFTLPADFIILEMKEDNKVPLILGRPFLHTVDAVIRVKQKQLNLGVGTERMIFNIDSAMKHSYSNDDTCFSINVIDEILEKDFDALLDEGSKILQSIEGTLLEEEIFLEFDEFTSMAKDENSESESDTEEPPFEKITINTDYKIKTSIKAPPANIELKPLPDNLEYVFLEEPSFLPVIISSQLSAQKKSKLFDRLADKQYGRPSRSLPSNTQPNPQGSKAYQSPQARNEHENAIFTRSCKSYNPPENPNEEQNKTKKPIKFDRDDEDDEPTLQSKIQNQKPVKETPLPKPYKPKIMYPQRLRKEKMETQYGKFLDVIRAVRIKVPLVNVLAKIPNYGKFLKKLISNKHKIEQIFVAFLSDESLAMIQNKVPPKLRDPKSFIIPCNFNKTFSYNALADLGASINLMTYSLYAKLSLKTLKSTKLNVSIDVIDEILEEDFDALLDEGWKILHSIEGTLLGEEIFLEFDEFIAMAEDENSESESDTEEPPFEKITINTDYKIKTSLEEPPTDLELKPHPDNLEYVFLEEPSFLPVIISSQLFTHKKSKLVSVLTKHKEVFAWKTADIPGICQSFCKHKIQLLDDKQPVVQKQRRLNPNMQEVVKKEIMKLLGTGIIYPIADSPWVSLIQCVPKKGGITVVINENDELVPTRTITGWRVCIDYCKLNETTEKDHFPLSFMDQMLERLAGNKYFCFLDGFSGYFQIPIDPNDQEKTTFTCPFGTYAYRRMPFGLCNALATFQRCMLAIFCDMIEESVKVFMDDFSVFRKSVDKCLNNLDKMLHHCKDAHLVLNWEKCHFMVKEGIVLGHKVSGAGLEFDRAKIDVISKLPPLLISKVLEVFLDMPVFTDVSLKISRR
ncbi:reverse transcriptase domain-containing protein [Tanacetum coccineum]